MYMTSRRIDIGKNKQWVLRFGNLHNRLWMKLCRIDFSVSFLQNWELYLLSNLLGITRFMETPVSLAKSRAPLEII